jgi:hypothetical protein
VVVVERYLPQPAEGKQAALAGAGAIEAQDLDRPTCARLLFGRRGRSGCKLSRGEVALEVALEAKVRIVGTQQQFVPSLALGVVASGAGQEQVRPRVGQLGEERLRTKVSTVASPVSSMGVRRNSCSGRRS